MIAHIRKAITAALVAGVAFYAKVAENGLTTDEIGQVIAAAVAAGLATWAVPNAGAPA